MEKTTTTSKGQLVNIEEQPRYYYYIILDGKVKKVQRKVKNFQHFLDLGITVFAWKSVNEKTKIEEINYSVDLEDYKKNKPAHISRQSQTDAILALQAQGLTAEEIVLKLLNK